MKIFNDLLDKASFESIMDIHIRTAPNVDKISEMKFKNKEEKSLESLNFAMIEEIKKLKEMYDKVTNHNDFLVSENYSLVKEVKNFKEMYERLQLIVI